MGRSKLMVFIKDQGNLFWSIWLEMSHSLVFWYLNWLGLNHYFIYMFFIDNNLCMKFHCNQSIISLASIQMFSLNQVSTTLNAKICRGGRNFINILMKLWIDYIWIISIIYGSIFVRKISFQSLPKCVDRWNWYFIVYLLYYTHNLLHMFLFKIWTYL